ncbi:hypothetical protein LSAT2_002989 [Lamellibrachia satsuma]|nr:hypothetical protein LSAT2_002989 [Lamellibrachia satsuma]
MPSIAEIGDVISMTESTEIPTEKRNKKNKEKKTKKRKSGDDSSSHDKSLSESIGTVDSADSTPSKKTKADKKKVLKSNAAENDSSSNSNAVEQDKKKKKKRKSGAAEQDMTLDNSSDGVAETECPQLKNGSEKKQKKKRKAETNGTDSDSSKKSKVEEAEKPQVALSPEEAAGDFSNFRISPGVIEKLTGHGVKFLFPIQAKTFDYVYDGEDVIAQARTGTGKTFSFAIPLVEKLLSHSLTQRGRAPKVLVLVPTRELAKQVARDFEVLSESLSVLCVYGGTPYWQQENGADDKVVHKRRYDACERKQDFQPHWLKQFSWLENNSSSAGADGAADRRDDDAVVDVEGYFAGPSWEKKIVGTGTDCASTMLGKNNGFVAKLRQRPLNRSNLKQAFDALGEIHRIPSRVGGTRWVPHISRAVSNVLKGYKGLVTHLSQVMNPDVPGRTTEQHAKAKNYYALLLLYFLHFLADVTAALSDVSTALQQKEITIADINSEITACKEIIEKYGKKDGPSLKIINDKDHFLGETIGAPSSAFEEARCGMVHWLLKSFSDRYEEGAEGIIAASSITNLKLWPTSLVHEKDFGDDKVDTLVKTFGQVLSSSALDVSKVEPEWTKLKSLLYTSYPTVKKLSWEEVNLSFGTQCPNVLGFIDLILTLPASSVDAERGFSHMKFVKSDWRSRLSDTHLSAF